MLVSPLHHGSSEWGDREGKGGEGRGGGREGREGREGRREAERNGGVKKRGGREEKGGEEEEKEVSSYKMHLTISVTSVATDSLLHQHHNMSVVVIGNGPMDRQEQGVISSIGHRVIGAPESTKEHGTQFIGTSTFQIYVKVLGSVAH